MYRVFFIVCLMISSSTFASEGGEKSSTHKNVVNFLRMRILGIHTQLSDQTQDQFQKEYENRLIKELVERSSEILLSKDSMETQILRLSLLHEEMIIRINTFFIPEDETDDLKLASFLIRYEDWTTVWNLVWVQVSHYLPGRWQLRDEFGDQFKALIGREVNFQYRVLYESQVKDQVMAQLNTNMTSFFKLNFDFETTKRNGKLNEVRVLAFHFSFINYQIAYFLKSQSKKLKEDVASILRKNFTPLQIFSILRSFKIPHHEDPLIDTQLKLLRIHIPTDLTFSSTVPQTAAPASSLVLNTMLASLMISLEAHAPL